MEIFLLEVFIALMFFFYFLPDGIEITAYRTIIQTLMMVVGVLFPLTINVASDTKDKISERLQYIYYWVNNLSKNILSSILVDPICNKVSLIKLHNILNIQCLM